MLIGNPVFILILLLTEFANCCLRDIFSQTGTVSLQPARFCLQLTLSSNQCILCLSLFALLIWRLLIEFIGTMLTFNTLNFKFNCNFALFELKYNWRFKNFWLQPHLLIFPQIWFDPFGHMYYPRRGVRALDKCVFSLLNWPQQTKKLEMAVNYDHRGRK